MMTNMKPIIDAYDWLSKQPDKTSKAHAAALENLIFEDLMNRDKTIKQQATEQTHLSPIKK